MSSSYSYRIGNGFDIHRFEDGDGVVLGGVKIPHSKKLIGHSDADVLIHAIMDALLGGAGMPDIGVLFPNTDPSLKGISSLSLLIEVMKQMSSKGFEVENIDTVILAEGPKIAPYRDQIKAKLSEALRIPIDAVGVKATTLESLGSLGRGEGMAASASVLLKKRV